MVAEAKRGDPAAIAAAVVQGVRAEIGLTLSEVHLIRRGTLPRTSSGKVRRAETKRRLEAGLLDLVTEGPPTPGVVAEGVVDGVQ